eukprot:GHVN01000321.1.p1 GENE.GHVN01000321.1~~GHVN01000321.1.p1  ORF type:complete len:273 (-),score=34.80 GHVN01000321.1:625-1407(-)
MKDGRGVIDRTKTNWADDIYATLFKVRWYKGGKKKERVPSWTDRIFKRSMPELYFCCSFNEDSYKAAEATFYNVLLGSDHTPVSCCFSLYPLAENLALPTVLLRIDEEKMDKINRNTIANYAKMKYRSTHLTIGSGSSRVGCQRALMNPVPSLYAESESQNVLQSGEEPNKSSIGRILDHVGIAGAGKSESRNHQNRETDMFECRYIETPEKRRGSRGRGYEVAGRALLVHSSDDEAKGVPFGSAKVIAMDGADWGALSE